MARMSFNVVDVGSKFGMLLTNIAETNLICSCKSSSFRVSSKCNRSIDNVASTLLPLEFAIGNCSHPLTILSFFNLSR